MKFKKLPIEPVDYDGEEVVMDEELLAKIIKEKKDRSGTLKYNFKMFLDINSFLE